jgi:ABC-2 type transport system permease protein
MANKTLLVAQRELLENLRTKTFWIGILAFPILISISMGAGWVLSKFKEQQKYAVVDLSAQQIGSRIERQARSGDFQSIARLLAKNKDLQGPLVELQRELAPQLEAMTPDAEAPEAQTKDLKPQVPAEVQERIAQWFQNLPATEADAFVRSQSSRLSAAKYRFASLDSLGIADLAPEEQEKKLSELVNTKKLFAYFVVGKEPDRNLDDFRYVSNNFTDNDLRSWYGNAATKVVQDLRIKTENIPTAVATRLREEVSFKEKKVTVTGETEDVKLADKAGGFAPMAFVYLLWIAVFTAAQMLLTNTVEEKSNRIIEVLLSSVSPLELMSGKIWGIAATGLTIIGSWVIFALIGVWLAPKLLVGMDLSWTAVIGDPLYLISFVVYFFFGYLLYAAILVGLGSVCNSLKEAQNLLQPVFILLVVPLVSMMFVVQEPNGTVAKVLSYVPLFTPFTMMNRAGGPPEVYEYVITGILLIVSVLIAFKAAGKVFRVGVLMTGNPPKLREILSWLREK